MRVLISVAASLMLMLALVGPVAAAGPGGCSAFGAASGGPGFGEGISHFARHLRMVSTIVQGEHADPTFCVQR